MSRAEIFIEDADVEGGGVEFKVNYVGGADVQSGAHQLANMIRRYLDDTLVLVRDEAANAPIPDQLAIVRG